MHISRFLMPLTAVFLTAACATVPTGGYYGDISELGTPGAVLARLEIGEGMLVETATLDDGRTINLQINKEAVPKGEALYPHVLTIGKFSVLLGSGFTGGENIYYRKRIGDQDRDVFEVDGKRYLVTWACNYRNPLTYAVADYYTVTIQRLFSPTEIESTR
jgi:hypothetical protein